MELQSLYKAQQIRKKNADNTYPLQHVISTVSDRAIPQEISSSGNVSFYQADIKSYSDYYPFGMQMPGRFETAAGHNYRFGFQGQESDNEMDGSKSYYSFSYRVHDSRIGRFLSQDPLRNDYPWNSTYAFAENSPILFIDLEGRERATPDPNTGNTRLLPPALREYEQRHGRVDIHNPKTVHGGNKKPVGKLTWYKFEQTHNPLTPQPENQRTTRVITQTVPNPLTTESITETANGTTVIFTPETPQGTLGISFEQAADESGNPISVTVEIGVIDESGNIRDRRTITTSAAGSLSIEYSLSEGEKLYDSYSFSQPVPGGSGLSTVTTSTTTVETTVMDNDEEQ